MVVLKKIFRKLKICQFIYYLVPTTIIPLHVRSKVCMALFHVWSELCIAPIHVRSKFVNFAPHMVGSNEDLEVSNADFALHMEQRLSVRVSKQA